MAKSVVKVHQFGLAVCGLLCTIAAVWSFVNDSYHGSLQGSVTRISMRVYQIALSLVLLSTTALGMKQPLKWFGLLESYIGSGLYVIFLAFFTLGLGNDFGMYANVTMLVVGILSICYGLVFKDERHNYPPLLA
ncbi:unnamed protein product [Aphanomyces euteiches]|uniref:EamA domain-containing protein n=1 Tax=Aphanomyces euteiches TaxID=100861 RepID=A0A6G0X1F3_9STRA|nr:hypothetical protein Ae201684_009550 [Aphanomyces euteiches]KAG9408108.1 hypothetical protein AC1031_021345 [Aphanomyces cochlioides]KAH9085808.1 hypothetical protein Ae201684P_005508 [Aphanomyces euteiches]KAH9104296.1 hypothetical protein AeMF1_019566 [Aphanomyces euteiches]KAH9108042.1 hypothetical protein LEN26_014221 [Aphanomyces euteiches]